MTLKHKNALICVWVLILVYLMLSETKAFEFLSNYNGIVTFLSVIICTFVEVLKGYKYSKEETLFVLLVALLFLQSVFLTNISIPAEIFFYLFILRKTDKKQLTRTTVYTILTVIVAAAILSSLKIIPDVSATINGRKLRTSLGFLYPSRPQTYLMVVIFLWINAEYQRKKHIKGLILIVILSVFCFITTDAKYPFIIGIMASIFSVVSVLSPYHVKKRELSVYCFALFAPIVPFILSVIYRSNIPWLVKLDNLLTGRLYYSLIAIRNRSLHFFNYLPSVSQSQETSRIYGYLDSGYLNVLYNFGIYLYIIFVLIMLIAACNTIKKKDYQMMITIVFTIVYSLWYGQVITLLQYSVPIILCTYCFPWKHVRRCDFLYQRRSISEG